MKAAVIIGSAAVIAVSGIAYYAISKGHIFGPSRKSFFELKPSGKVSATMVRGRGTGSTGGNSAPAETSKPTFGEDVNEALNSTVSMLAAGGPVGEALKKYAGINISDYVKYLA